MLFNYQEGPLFDKYTSVDYSIHISSLEDLGMARTKQTTRKSTGGKTMPAESLNQNNDGSPPTINDGSPPNTNEAAVRLITSSIRSISNNTNGITNSSILPQQNNPIANDDTADNESMDASQSEVIRGSSIQLNDVLFTSGDCDTTSLATFIFSNIGNCRFRVLVEANLFKYFGGDITSTLFQQTTYTPTTKQLEVARGVIMSVMGNNPPGRFLVSIDNTEPSSVSEMNWGLATFDEFISYVHSVFRAAGQFYCDTREAQSMTTSPTQESTSFRLPLIPEGHGGLLSDQSIQSKDVLSGRGRVNLHPGNVNLRALAKTYKQQYDAVGMGEKGSIVASLVNTVRAGGGRFLKEVAVQEGIRKWEEIGDANATAKVSQLLRDVYKKQQPKKKKTDDDVTTQPPLLLPSKKKGATTQPSKKKGKKRLEYKSSIPTLLTALTLESSNATVSTPQTSAVVVPPKKKKDTNKPKRSRSSYNYFFSEQHKIIKAANPNVIDSANRFECYEKYNSGIVKSVAEKWKRLSAGDKAPYEKLAAEDKERYDCEMAVYKAAEDKEGLSWKKKKKSSSQKTKKQKTDDDVDMWKRTSIYPKNENEKRELLSRALNGKNVEHALSDEVGLKLYFRMAKAINPSGNPETWTAQARQTLDNEKRLYPVKKQFAWHLLKFPATKPPSS